MNDKKKFYNKPSDTEKVVYSVLGGVVISCFAPMYIPYCLCFGGLMIGLYGTFDVISKSDVRSQFDLKQYIETKN